MIRETYVFRDGELIPKRLAAPLIPRGQRSHLGFNFISDKLWDIQGQHDGMVYDSKSLLRRSYRELGLVEVGNDAPLEASSPPRPALRDEVGDAYRMVRDGYKPQIEHPVDLEALPRADREFDLAEAGADERQATD